MAGSSVKSLPDPPQRYVAASPDDATTTRARHPTKEPLDTKRIRSGTRVTRQVEHRIVLPGPCAETAHLARDARNSDHPPARGAGNEEVNPESLVRRYAWILRRGSPLVARSP